MNRFFATFDGDKPRLSPESIHHIVSVLRTKVGEEIEISAEGKVFLASVICLDPFEVKVLKESEEKRDTGISIYLGFSLLKGGHDDFVIQKGTELGVKEFYPFFSERTIVLLNDDKKKDKRKERFEKIASSSSEQCKRSSAPIVHDIAPFSYLLGVNSSHRYIAYEGEAGGYDSLMKELPNIKKGESVFILIGPEGGFSKDEVFAANNHGFKSLSLGRRILRAETSSIMVSALFGAYGDEL